MRCTAIMWAAKPGPDLTHAREAARYGIQLMLEGTTARIPSILKIEYYYKMNSEGLLGCRPR